jgi:hypothetical protein
MKKLIGLMVLSLVSVSAYCQNPWPPVAWPNTFNFKITLGTCTGIVNNSTLAGNVSFTGLGHNSSTWTAVGSSGWDGSTIPVPQALPDSQEQVSNVSVTLEEGNTGILTLLVNGETAETFTLNYSNSGQPPVVTSGSMPAPYQLSMTGTDYNGVYDRNVTILYSCSGSDVHVDK